MKPTSVPIEPAAPASQRESCSGSAATRPTGDNVTDLASRLRADQGRRWQSGEGVAAESYFAQFPELRSSTECAVDLVYSEFLIREELGEQPQPEEYLSRFPEFGTELRRQFAL